VSGTETGGETGRVDPDGDGDADPDGDADGGSGVSVSAVRDALREVVDPCSAATGSNLDVVELGLVKSIAVEDGHVEVDLRLTTPACTMHPYFIRETETHVGALQGVASVEVRTDDGTEWSESLMSAAAKRRRREVLDGYAERYGGETAGRESDRENPK